MCREPAFVSALMGSSVWFPAWATCWAECFPWCFQFAAWIRGVPYVTLVRMVANMGIGVLVGTIPLLR